MPVIADSVAVISLGVDGPQQRLFLVFCFAAASVAFIESVTFCTHVVLISGKWTETKQRKGAFSAFPQRVHCGRVVCITAVHAKSAQGGQLDGVLAHRRPRLALFPSPPRPNPSCVAQGPLPRRCSLLTFCSPVFATADTFFSAWKKKQKKPRVHKGHQSCDLG